MASMWCLHLQEAHGKESPFAVFTAVCRAAHARTQLAVPPGVRHREQHTHARGWSARVRRPMHTSVVPKRFTAHEVVPDVQCPDNHG